MRLFDSCLLSLSAAAFIIGVHQIITIGFAQGYWLIMLSSILLLWFGIRKRSRESAEVDQKKSAGHSKRPVASHQSPSRRAPSRRKKKSR